VLLLINKIKELYEFKGIENLKISKGYYLHIYSQANKLIASHKLSLKKSTVVIDPNHYKSYKTLAGSFEMLKAKFLECFPGKEMFVEKLKAQKRMNVFVGTTVDFSKSPAIG